MGNRCFSFLRSEEDSSISPDRETDEDPESQADGSQDVKYNGAKDSAHDFPQDENAPQDVPEDHPDLALKLSSCSRKVPVKRATVAGEVQKINFREFPKKLGPWETPITSFNHMHFHMLDPQLKSNNPFFIIYADALKEHTLLARLITFPLIGQTSPKYLVTLPKMSRESANIPETAMYFVWSYPIDIEWKMDSKTDEKRVVHLLKQGNLFRHPDLLFMLSGGYMYFDDHFKIVGVNAVRLPRTNQMTAKYEREGKGLWFSKPRIFEDKYIEAFVRDDRFKLALHNTEGVKWFAWLLPSEVIKEPKGDNFTAGEHGSFVFLFSDLIKPSISAVSRNKCYDVIECNPNYIDGDGETCPSPVPQNIPMKKQESIKNPSEIPTQSTRLTMERPISESKTQRNLPMASRGVSLEVFKRLAKEFVKVRGQSCDDFKERFGRRPTNGEILVELVLKPEMGNLQLSYAEFLMKNESKHVFRCNAYVTHAWACDFSDTVKAMEEFEKNRTSRSTLYYFCDLLSVNQWDKKEDPITVPEVKGLVAKVEELVCVLYPWDELELFGRLWVIFEIALAVQYKTNLSITLPPSQSNLFKEMIKKDFAKFEKWLRMIDAEKAKASRGEDQKMICEVILAEMGEFNNCNRRVHDQLRKWFARQVYRMDEMCTDPEPDFLLSSAILLRQRGEANRRKALKMVKRCYDIREVRNNPRKYRSCRIQEAHILYELDDLEGSFKLTERVMKPLSDTIQQNNADSYAKIDFLKLFYLRGVIQNGLEQPHKALRTLKKVKFLAKSWFGKTSDEYLDAMGWLGTLLLEQKHFRTALRILEAQCKRQINSNTGNQKELTSAELKLASCLSGLGAHDRAFEIADESVKKLERENFVRNEDLVDAKCTLQDIKNARDKPHDLEEIQEDDYEVKAESRKESEIVIEEEEEQEIGVDPLYDIDSYMNLEDDDFPPLNRENTIPARMQITISDYVAEQEVRTKLLKSTRLITMNKAYQNIQLEFSRHFLKLLKKHADVERKEECDDMKMSSESNTFRQYADKIINCYLVSNFHILIGRLNFRSQNMSSSDKELENTLKALNRKRETLEKKRLYLRQNGLEIPSAKLDTLITFCEKLFQEAEWDTSEITGFINPEERSHIVKELRQNFMYTIKDNAQIKAELESQTKEKEWMKRNWMETLVDICTYLYGLEDNVANNYIGKTILQFAYPFLPIPYLETIATTEFKENDQVVVLPSMERQNPRGKSYMIGRIIEHGEVTSRVALHSDVDNPIEKEVPNKHLARSFTWQCWRCANMKREADLWRDVYPEKNWIECLRCGLVSLKVGVADKQYIKRHIVRKSAFGFIYFGYDWKFARDVAIKECNIQHMKQRIRLDNNVSVAEDVEKEIELHMKVSDPEKGISHPGIISIYETFWTDVTLNIVLEWADQGDLFDYVQKHFKNPENLSDRELIGKWQTEIQKKFYLMCSATKFMHDRDIVHRDISMENTLMITNKNIEPGFPDVLPRICDFGLATEYTGKRFQASVGKSGYWSPECDHGNYDGKSNDVWCLGVALFLMLFGGPPYAQLDSQAFYMILQKNSLKKLIRMYELPHLLPDGALETLSRIFKYENNRCSINEVLKTRWMREAEVMLPKIKY